MRRWPCGPTGKLPVFLTLLLFLVASIAPPKAANASGQSKPSRNIQIVAFGDSLTAGFNLPPDASFPAQLEAALKQRGHNVTVINSGVSGDTSAAGLARFDWAFPDTADAAIVQLGANDALRGISPEETDKNLSEILAKLKQRKIPVLIAGMRALRNWGEEYARQFDRIYPDLAARTGARLYPFFLEGVALRADLNLADGLHPNRKGVAVIVDRILPDVEKLIGDATRPND